MFHLYTCIGHAKLKLFADDVMLYSSFNVDFSYCGNLHAVSRSSIFVGQVLATKRQTKSQCRPIIPHLYFINGSQLTNSSSVTDLCMPVDSHLTFNLHISNILTKATERVGVFFRGFSSRHTAVMKKAFITYIHPSLEFNSNIWNPTTKYQIDELENIQRRFTKSVTFISHLSYLERLRALELEPLELGRLKLTLSSITKS